MTKRSLRRMHGNPVLVAATPLLFAIIALSLSSCLTPTGKQKPAEVINYGVQGGAGSTGIHTVLAGDTVYTVSQKYNLPLRDIITVNNLSAPYRLSLGYRLKLPPPNEYRVRPGDTLNGVSRLFNASVSEMARLNNLQSPYTIENGQVLRLPSQQPALRQEFASNAAQPSFASEPTTSGPLRVEAVEAVTLEPLPGSVQTAAVAATPALPGAAATARQATGFPPQPAAPSTLTPPSPAVKTDAALASVAPEVPSRSGSRFMRPVDGRVISGFGPKGDGLSNDGINIKAAKGTPVRAVENGVVAYTGNEMQGYGNLVLIRHADRWMTAYAHMNKILVKKGDTVKAGQSIGTVGATGGVDSPQLHFEVRKGTEAVDPAKYL